MTDLLGEPTDPSDLDLGPTQRLVIRELRRLRTLLTAEAGAIVHEQRGRHARADICAYCGIDGRDVLDALAKKGLCERGAEGVYQLPAARVATGGPGDLPDGFRTVATRARGR